MLSSLYFQFWAKGAIRGVTIPCYYIQVVRPEIAFQGIIPPYQFVGHQVGLPFKPYQIWWIPKWSRFSRTHSCQSRLSPYWSKDQWRNKIGQCHHYSSFIESKGVRHQGAWFNKLSAWGVAKQSIETNLGRKYAGVELIGWFGKLSNAAPLEAKSQMPINEPYLHLGQWRTITRLASLLRTHQTWIWFSMSFDPDVSWILAPCPELAQ